MKIREFQAREIFARHGIPVPKSTLVRTVTEAVAAAKGIDGPTIIKAQVLAGGRGKAGGVKLATSPAEVRSFAESILNLRIGSEPVSSVLVGPAVDIVRELYLSITIDRTAQQLLLMASPDGGIDIEETALTKPSAIHKISITLLHEIPEWQLRELAFNLHLEGSQIMQFINVANGLHAAFLDVDASLAEINPLVVDSEGNLQAIDAKLTIDDNALYRQPSITQLREAHDESPAERRARESGLSYIKLDGSIGCMVNGAGLAMATMDVIQHHGGEPANFLDVGGGAGVDRITTAFDILLEDPNVRAVLINIFGGITRADDVATGVIAAQNRLPRKVPIVVRVAGTREAEALQLLEAAGIRAQASMDTAAARVVEATR